MIENLFWMAAGAAFYRFFPGIAMGIYRAGKSAFSKIKLPF